MSSIVISGDVSGTVTLDAPTVAGTTVLTLPATSGTVVTTATTTGISGSAITTGTVGVSVGGTGANTLTANNVILGNGTSAVQFVAPGSSGNVLTSNGTTWTSAAAGGGQFQTQVFTAPGTWTRPASTTQVRVTVVGGGGGSGTPGNGAVGGSGGTSSFGPAVSATGGGGGSGSPVFEGSTGTGSLSAGTILRNGNVSFTTSDIIDGQASTDSSPKTFSPTSPFQAGGRGNSTNPATSGSGGRGGMIMAITPVSAPVSVTVGTGGAGALNPNGTSVGGVSGAVVVEFVG